MTEVVPEDVKLTFDDHKSKTVEDLHAVAGIITDLAKEVEKGDMARFERFWMPEKDDAEENHTIMSLTQMLVFRYMVRKEDLPQ